MNLNFKKFTQEHIPFYYEWRNNPDVAVYDQIEFLRPMSYEEVDTWSQRMVEGPTFLICDGDKPIGTCAFMGLDQRNRHAELAIVIGDMDYWGKGYGYQIMRQLLDWGFEGLNLRRLYLNVFDFNERAIALYKKCGFKEEGRLREMVYRHGKYHDILTFGLMKDEWHNL